MVTEATPLMTEDEIRHAEQWAQYAKDLGLAGDREHAILRMASDIRTLKEKLGDALWNVACLMQVDPKISRDAVNKVFEDAKKWKGI